MTDVPDIHYLVSLTACLFPLMGGVCFTMQYTAPNDKKNDAPKITSAEDVIA
jgi:hypothetical protein